MMMNNPPSGNITLMFTDIEGSTKLAQDYPESLQAALEIHNSILHRSVESNKGFVFEIVGDAFCCAFEKAEDAVKASVKAQIDLQNEKWNEAVIRIRIGIHSGKAEWNGTKYMGYITLTRAEKVMSAAYGEQILISNDAYENYFRNTGTLSEKGNDVNSQDHKNFKVKFRDLGERRLKDLNQPVRIYQILSDKLRTEFPPIKTLDARPNNLPVQMTNFIGREKEIKHAKELLNNTRLLTLTGSGGAGKTRFALQTGADLIDDFENGVWIAELAAVNDPEYLPQSVINVLGLKEDHKKTFTESLSDYLKDKKILIILDNCEHLISACSDLAEKLLFYCPDLKIITTSREALNCEGEQIFRIPSLSQPDPGTVAAPEELIQYESIRLFTERALAVNPGFRVNNDNASVLTEICSLLDGIPLAIELAAARIKVLTLEKIRERMDDRFNLLTGGKRTALPRHQTLRAMIDWSYDLLSEKEKILLQRFSIFSGGWTLDASEKICSDEFIDEFEILDLLSNLNNKSLVKSLESDHSLRFTMLESIKKYGDEKLTASGKKSAFQKKHFDYFYKLAENSETGLNGTGQKEQLRRLSSDYENIRNSLIWSLENDPESSLKMAVCLCKFWELLSYFTEAIEYLQKSLEKYEKTDTVWKARAIYWTGFFYVHQGKYEESKKFLEKCLGMFRILNDKDGEAMTLMSLGMVALFQVDYESLNNFAGESLKISEEINNRSYIARNLQNIGLGLLQQGFHEEARIKFEQGIQIYRDINDSVQLAKIIGNIGALEYLSGNYQKAKVVFEESLALRTEMGDRQGMSIAMSNLGSVAYMLKDFDEAESQLDQSRKILKEIGDRRVYVTTISTLGSIAIEKKDYSKAVKMFSEAVLISFELGDNYTIAKGFEGFADVFARLKMYEEACLLSAKYFDLLQSSHRNLIEAELKRIEEVTTDLRSNLDKNVFESLMTRGKSMTIDETLEYAVSREIPVSC